MKNKVYNFYSEEQGIRNIKLVLKEIEDRNLELNGTNFNDMRYWIGKLPQYVPTWVDYLKRKDK